MKPDKHAVRRERISYLEGLLQGLKLHKLTADELNAFLQQYRVEIERLNKQIEGKQ